MTGPRTLPAFWADFRATHRHEMKALDADPVHQETLARLEDTWSNDPEGSRRLLREVYAGAIDDGERCALLRIHFDDLGYPWDDPQLDSWLEAEATTVEGFREVLDATIAHAQNFLPTKPRRPDKPRWRERPHAQGLGRHPEQQ